MALKYYSQAKTKQNISEVEMKKIIISSIIIITIILMLNIKEEDLNKKEQISILIDYEKANVFPTKGDYYVEVNCVNSKGKWNYETWKLELIEIKDKSSCAINFTSSGSIKLTDHIKSLEGSEQIGTGTVTNELGYRYQGKNPNNYIWFNNELWRILGVFDIETDIGTTETLTKIIKDTPLESSSYDVGGDNTWEGSDVEIRLNDYYYNSTDATATSHCKSYKTAIDMNCDYTTKGIKPNYQNLIQTVKWPIGKYSTDEATSLVFYTAEQTATWTGNIGLMTVSDYGLTTLSSNCSRTTNLFEYYPNACAGSSWIEKNAGQWTMTGESDDFYDVFFIFWTGDVTTDPANHGYALRPSVYLKSNTKYIGGDGTQSNPIIIN